MVPQPPNFTPSWINQNQRRDNRLDEAIFVAICVAVGYWIGKHWYLRAVRFLTGGVLGYIVGLVGIGALLSGNTSSAATWLTVILAIIPAVLLGELLARFGGQGAEVRHQTTGKGRHAA